MEKPTVRISVRNLVEFILRRGDIDNRRNSNDKEAMQKGSRIHRKIQNKMGSHYKSEVSLKWRSEYDDVVILVEGRADGIFEEEEQVCIDEIKGVFTKIENITEPLPVHKAQAMCYGRIYGETQGLSEIGIQMTYANLDTEEICRFREKYTLDELKKWYKALMDSYHKWISYQLKWREKRNASMQNLEFPFPYREGQRQMVSGVYHAISKEKQIFIQAPTGVGKTMSTIFPAVRAVGEEKGETIFYLTAKTITRTVAEEAFEVLAQKGLKFKSITITAKEKMCLCTEVECNPDACPYAKGHYDRINDAVYELWKDGDSYNREILLEHAEKWKVCPFELSLDLALWVDGVICDYNYVFDPNAQLKRFFGENKCGKYIFLVDEAHNLVDRGREMYSADICKEEVLEVRGKIKEKYPGLAKALERVNKQLLEMKKSCEQYEILDGPGPFPLSLLRVMGEMDRIMEETPEQKFKEDILEFYFGVRDFLNISELVDENYVVYTENGEDGKFRLHLFCVNPAANLGECLSKGVSTVFFSATFLPMKYYREVLSTEKDTYGIYVPSPFPRENRCLLIGDDVSSRYTKRNYGEYRKTAEYIARLIWQKKGNYMIFFPSYKFMEEVYAVYEDEFSVGWIRSICQKNDMSEREREIFLEEFSEDGAVVGFCVMGGVFAEGIDLIGDRLIGAVVVGTGLPQISNEREILRKYYDAKGENGFDYAYRFPGMNKVLQASGRVIRTQYDKGVILLLDDRFWNRDYQGLFPAEWIDRKRCRLKTIEEELQEFWNEK